MATSPKRLVRLISVPPGMDAAVMIATLADNGIHATQVGEYILSPYATGLVDILVAEEDLAAAQRIAANFTEAPAKIDWSKVDVGEPDEE